MSSAILSSLATRADPALAYGLGNAPPPKTGGLFGRKQPRSEAEIRAIREEAERRREEREAEENPGELVTLPSGIQYRELDEGRADGKTAAVAPEAPNGVKLEAFIFDVYAFASSVAFLNGDRASDFAPVKNKEGAGKDSPDTARALLSNLHRTWIERNGGVVVGDGRIEVAPAVSYDGARGLEFAKGRRFAADQAVEEDFWVEATQTSARETRGAEGETRGAEEGAKRAKTK